MANLWEPKQRIERNYQRSLQEIAKQIIMRVGDNPDIETIKSVLNQMARSKEYKQFAENTALNMVTQLFSDTGRTWRQAAAANSKGKSIYAVLQEELRGKSGEYLNEQIKCNANMIKTLPDDIAADVTRYVANETTKGRRKEDIAAEIAKKFPEQTKARSDLIARTEVSKTQSAITEGRCRLFGVNWYVWRAVGGSGGDGRTRKSHRGLSGVLVAWDDPPAPEDLFPTVSKSGKRYRNTLGHYHAGCCPNCRCYAEPVIDLDMFVWPMRIYRNGHIEKISRKTFEKLAA